MIRDVFGMAALMALGYGALVFLPLVLEAPQ